MENVETNYKCDCCNKRYGSAIDVRHTIALDLPNGFLAYHFVCARCAKIAEESIRSLFPNGKNKFTVWELKLKEKVEENK